MKKSKIVAKSVKARLIKSCNPLKIYWFGHYAWGSSGRMLATSIVVVLDGLSKRVPRKIIDAYPDINFEVCSHEKFIEETSDTSARFYRVKRKGVLLYARMSSMKGLLESSLRELYSGQKLLNEREKDAANVQHQKGLDTANQKMTSLSPFFTFIRKELRNRLF